jgi:flagellar hook-basal body complex protein FliE
MAIKTDLTAQQMFKSYGTKDWAKSVEFGKTVDFNVADGAKEGPKDIKSFGEFLSDSIQKVNSLQQDADVAVQKLASGESKNLHETLLAVERAEIAFKTMNQIRGKVIDAYKEIMKMQV